MEVYNLKTIAAVVTNYHHCGWFISIPVVVN
jgi:hypothetical protein